MLVEDDGIAREAGYEFSRRPIGRINGKNCCIVLGQHQRVIRKQPATCERDPQGCSHPPLRPALIVEIDVNRTGKSGKALLSRLKYRMSQRVKRILALWPGA
jgi:hypothetical protein